MNKGITINREGGKMKEKLNNLISREFLTSLVGMGLGTWVMKNFPTTTQNLVVYLLFLSGGLSNYLINRTIQKKNGK